MNKVKITTTGQMVGTRVEINGVEVQELIDVNFRHNVGEPAVMTLTVFVQELELEGDLTEKSTVIEPRGDVYCPTCMTFRPAWINYGTGAIVCDECDTVLWKPKGA